MKSEEGFTLIEVVASLVILTIILMFFSSIFVQNSKTAVRNSDKLVVTHIADAYLERLKVEGFNPAEVKTCSGTTSTYTDEYKLNNHDYKVTIERLNIFNGLCNTVVSVLGKNEKLTGVVEGYVQFNE